MSKTKAEPTWKGKLLEWQASGKSVRIWCFEHQIPITTFYGWKNRLKKLSSNLHQTAPQKPPQQLDAPHGFIELRDKRPSETGIILEYGKVKIHLLSAFDPCALKQCIACLRGETC
jgi:hypothetical protein